MKLIISLLLLVCNVNSYAGKAFLGKHSQFSFNITEAFIQKKMNLEYSFYLSRTYGISISGGVENGKYLLNDKGTFNLTQQTDIGINDAYIAMDGGELFIRFVRGNGFENNVIPVGYTVALGIGVTNYDITERYHISNYFVSRNNSKVSLIYDLRLQKTFNIYQSLNLFIGSNLGLINSLSNQKEDDAENVFYSLPKRGLNNAYSARSKMFERLYFNVHMGIALML